MRPRSDPRNRLIRRVHARARELGVDEETRRALQLRVVGKASCRAMSEPELRDIVAALERAGGRRGRLPAPPAGAKLRALWISGWHLGVVRDRSDAGCEAWLKRQTGLDSGSWATPPDVARAIEALRRWLAREGGVDWSGYPVAGPNNTDRLVENNRARVIEAQWRILAELGAPGPEREDLRTFASRVSGRKLGSHLELRDDEADKLIRRLGVAVRKGRAA